jgi:hypothetical protein
MFGRPIGLFIFEKEERDPKSFGKLEPLQLPQLQAGGKFVKMAPNFLPRSSSSSNRSAIDRLYIDRYLARDRPCVA